MSSSVVLEGLVTWEEPDLRWNGVWRFSKDRKGTLAFKFKRVSMEVDKDLLDYVSFLDPVSIAGNFHRAGASLSSSSNSKKKKTSTETFPLLVSPSQNLNSAPVAETQATSSVLSPSVNAYNGNNFDDDNFNTADRMEDGNFPLDTSNNVIESSVEIKEEPLQSVTEKITINKTHPFMGLWQGSFTVKNIKGQEEEVQETFFLHSLLGAGVVSNLKDLPPEPQFPYCLLKSHKDNLGASSAEEGGTAPVPSMMALGSISLDPSDPSAPPPAATTTTVDITPQAFEELSKKVLIGFGRNPIGRFSIAAMYDEQSGELRCEKKYMTVKFAVKRGRRSHAEYAMLHPNNPRGGPQPPAITSEPAETRQRTGRSLSFAHFLDEEYATEPPGGKRKARAPYGSLKAQRSHSIGGGSSSNYHYSSSSAAAGGGDYGYHNSSSSISYQHPNLTRQPLILTGEQLQVAMENDPDAIIGPRNPDLDNPDANYREAFQDCDTGEIYEGEVSRGLRHGRGVLLYADGLLYEGHFWKGREHGHGVLMTGDRTIIYTGDWLEGSFNGRGTYYYASVNQDENERYEGDWKEGLRHGKGDYYYRNGCIYRGDWREHRRHGRGLFTWPDGSRYDGDWEGDLRHGRGFLQLENGFSYDGQWHRNVMEGRGICTFPSGQVYQGTFRNGLRDGRGSIQFAEGPVYEGRFKEDRLDGQGTLHITNTVPGLEENDVLIPVQMQSDLWRIHWKAGFGASAH